MDKVNFSGVAWSAPHACAAPAAVTATAIALPTVLLLAMAHLYLTCSFSPVAAWRPRGGARHRPGPSGASLMDSWDPRRRVGRRRAARTAGGIKLALNYWVDAGITRQNSVLRPL